MELHRFKRLAILGLLAATAAGAAGAQRQLDRFSRPGTRLGAGLAEIGDVDRDGVRDWAFGAPVVGGGNGAVFVRSGRTGTVIRTVFGRARSTFGIAVAGVGDVDRDGYDDWIAGGPSLPSLISATVPGYVTLISGRTGRSLREHTGKRNAQFGYAVAGIGDVNADGIPDYAVGSPGPSTNSPAGRVYFYSGRTGDVLREHARIGRFGHSIVRVDDLNRDGVSEIAVGNPELNPPSRNLVRGEVTVISGSGLIVLITHQGPTLGDRFGFALDTLPDRNRDGRSELLVGAPTRLRSGSAYIVAPFTGQRLQSLTQGGRDERFGSSVAGLGDLDLDGIADYAVGSRLHSVGNGPPVGGISLRSGATGGSLGFLAHTRTNAEFGAGIIRVADRDRDGVSEFLVSAPGAGEVQLLTYEWPGTARRFGAGCAGSAGTPVLSGSLPIAIGRSMSLQVSSQPASAAGFLILGGSDRTWQNIRLPLALGPFGFGSCRLLASFDALAPAGADASGTTRLSVPLPDAARLVGARAYLQHITADARAPGGATFSNGLAVRVGY